MSRGFLSFCGLLMINAGNMFQTVHFWPLMHLSLTMALHGTVMVLDIPIGNCRKIHDFFSFNLQLGPDSSPSAFSTHSAHPDDSSLTTIYQNPPRGQLHPMQQCAALPANCYLLDPEVQHENHVTRLGLRTTLEH